MNEKKESSGTHDTDAGPSPDAANKESWTDRVPALSAAVTQLSNTLSTLKQRTAQAGGIAAEEGQAWQRRITSLTGHLTGALSGSHPGAEHAKSQGLVLSAEVAAAMREGRAVVALESTIITHGMPWPANLETARGVEGIVRAHGGVPATVAVLAGVPHVGLTDGQLQALASRGKAVRKTSRLGLAYVMARRLDGATTVSATMLLAHRAGIHVFVTGGIGGVHRGGEASMDISADLTELGRTPVAVVCAGAKSILDIPRTLEVLETQGVTVAAYRSNRWPAFFSADSGCAAPLRLDSAEEAAALIRANLQLRLDSGALIGVPIPAEHAVEGAVVERATQAALAEAARQGISGAALTPFLLARIGEMTRGASLAANIALIRHNAAVGTDIAVALAALA